MQFITSGEMSGGTHGGDPAQIVYCFSQISEDNSPA